MTPLRLLAFCAAVYGLAVPRLQTEAEVSVRQPNNITATRDDSFSSSGIFSRDQSQAWIEAQAFVGHELEHNKYYYFMSCNRAYRNHYFTQEAYLKYVVDQTGCVHVGLVVGKTSRFFKKFEAEYLHVRILDKNPDRWTQTRHDWDGPVVDQRLVDPKSTTSLSVCLLLY